MNPVLRKISRRFLVPALLLSAGTSCGLLDENPLSQAEESQLISDEKTLYLTTLGRLYAQLGASESGEGLTGTGRGISDLQILTADEALIPVRGGDWYDGGLWLRLYQHNWDLGEAPIQNAWNYLYRMIVLANRSLDTLSRYRNLLSDGSFSHYAAEIRALRALFYYYLLDLYARVPVVTSPTATLSDVEQSPRSAVFAFVRDELEAAALVLPRERSNVPGVWYGRMTGPVADFLLAKLYLNADVYLDDDWTDGVRETHPDCYRLADNCCDRVNDGLDYSLEPDYRRNFSVTNEASRENIFTIPADPLRYSAQNHLNFRSLHYEHAAACGVSGENGLSATPELLEANHYAQADEDARLGWNFWTGTALDLSGKAVVASDGKELTYLPLDIDLVLTGLAGEKMGGARSRKYEIDPGSLKDGKLANNDLVLFRYADVMLMQAEARIRLGGDGSDLVNAVRARAGAAALPDAATLEDVLNERMLELPWEGWRRQDLIRFGLFEKKRSFYEPDAKALTGYTTVFPIPAGTLSNHKGLRQNPGYE